MYVKNKMTANPYTIRPNASISDAFSIMKDHGFHQLPVVKNGKLVGMLTETELQNVTPSKATSLSVYEINYLLTKIDVSQAMSTDPVTIEADALLEKAAVLMRSHDVRALPVMEGKKLVGIITQSDIFDAFIDMMGARNAGARIEVHVPNKPGVGVEVMKVIGETGANIMHMALHNGADEGELDFKLDIEDASAICAKLNQMGYKAKC
ncbi:MAG: CBS and ACT domain-containing protein [Clostridiales bacterium]|nr:CBS and ACT domain-containing protein [Clostridiales bacterium]